MPDSGSLAAVQFKTIVCPVAAADRFDGVVGGVGSGRTITPAVAVEGRCLPSSTMSWKDRLPSAALAIAGAMNVARALFELESATRLPESWNHRKAGASSGSEL